MWPRTVEVMLALWLVVSPFIFDFGGSRSLWILTWGTAVLVFVFSLAAFARRFERAHLGTLVVGLTLAVVAYVLSADMRSAPLQNLIVLGLCLAMMAVIPSRCDSPPGKWQEFYRQRANED